MKNQNSQNLSRNSQAAQLKAQVKSSLIAVGIGIVLLLLSMFGNYYLSSMQSGQLQQTMALNQYRLGSKTLTYAVQSYAVTGDSAFYDDYMKELNEDKNRDKALEIMHESDITDEEWAVLDQIAGLSEGLVPLETQAMEYAAQGNTKAAQECVFSAEYEDTVGQINQLTDTVINQIQERKEAQRIQIYVFQLLFQAIFVVSFLYVVLRIVKIIKFAQSELLSPIEKVSEQMGELAQGNFHTDLDLKADDSEVGRLASSIAFMKQNILGMVDEISEVLELMGSGNYRFEIKREYVGEFIKIKESFLKIGEEMRDTLTTIREVSDQIDKGSEQLACAAQDLAEGSTSQAQQVSDLVSVVENMTRDMEENAAEAEASVELAGQAGTLMQAGNEKMQELKTAIEEISKCSEQIGTIIGAIEDIASQTNLLSLNAAIEAARAGEAGKGFAVVADQVKNLAEESAKAAGRTTKLIETTIEAVNRGITIADATAEDMVEIMDSAKSATDKMNQIASMLNTNVSNMHKINTSISEVSSIVDNNSATSEETAAVSEEQKAQVETMVSLMDHFKI